jgi:twitching motility protein PilJ
VRSRIPLKYFNNILQTEAKQLAQSIKDFGSEEYLAVNDIGKVVVAPTSRIEYIGKNAEIVFHKAAAQLQAADSVGTVVDVDQLGTERISRILCADSPTPRASRVELECDDYPTYSRGICGT